MDIWQLKVDLDTYIYLNISDIIYAIETALTVYTRIGHPLRILFRCSDRATF